MNNEVELVTSYHVFMDGRDDWVDTLEEAHDLIIAWKDEYGDDINWRIYIEESEVDGDMVNEDYLDGEGEFPW